MVNFVLPNCVENSIINNVLFTLTKIHPTMLKYKSIAISGQQGAIPYCSWNGGINNNTGNGMYYPGLVQMQQDSLNHRINFANVLLEDYDYYDNLAQTVLKIFDDGSTKLEVSSIPLMEKIQENYPNYRFMFSKQADLITPFTPELLNEIAASDNFILIGIPNQYTHDFEWLSQLNNKRLYEITINPFCESCSSCQSCALKEQENQLAYSGTSLILTCQKHFNQHPLTMDEIMTVYKPKGFVNFTFETDYLTDLDQIMANYIMFFFKEEYWLTLIAEAKQLGQNMSNGRTING